MRAIIVSAYVFNAFFSAPAVTEISLHLAAWRYTFLLCHIEPEHRRELDPA